VVEAGAVAMAMIPLLDNSPLDLVAFSRIDEVRAGCCLDFKETAVRF
jgi:hypothetical protein